MLDEFLSVIPDQPEVEGLYPEAKTIDGIPSNSVVDWCRATDFMTILMNNKEANSIII